MRFPSRQAISLVIGQEYWFAWHHCYQIYKAVYIGLHPINGNHLFETRSYSGIYSFSNKDLDSYYICSGEIEVRQALIQELEKNLVEAKTYLKQLIEKTNNSLK